ncbi:IS3 family transposase [Pseudovibrio sp. Tun.PSC04-5.I4]|uniref:IS3 family transposase n=1 Tax=Pseudovibrio sp. Tun.PSC04-5.I4 TaxID=1798213 RepID=UPI00117A2367|nr:IS3 family transposase [Pseudovibrio sp. Tun.PSC04-5.I4]
MNVDRSSGRYKRFRADDVPLRVTMKKIAFECRRFGHRRIHAMLQREGITMNLKKLHLLHRDEGLQFRKPNG